MSENRSASGTSQGSTNKPRLPTSEEFALSLSRGHPLWVVQVWNVDEPGQWIGQFYKPGVIDGFAADTGHYFSCAAIKPDAMLKPGESSLRRNSNFLCALAFVAEDVGIIHGGGVAASMTGAKTDKDLFEIIAPPWSWRIQSSKGNWHYGFRLHPVFDYARWRRFLKLAGKHPLLANTIKDSGDAVHYFRLPSGINTKPGRGGFQMVFEDYNPTVVYTLDKLAALFGIDLDAPDDVSGKAKASMETCSVETMKAILDAIPNTAKAFPRGEWTGVCHAVKNTLDEDGKEPWLDWSATFDGPIRDGEAEKVWDTLPEDHKNDLGSLRKILIGIHGEDSDIVGRIKQMIANDQAPLGVIPDEPGMAGAGSLHSKMSEWNPWEQSGGPNFPVVVLPKPAHDWVTTNAASSGCDVSAFAMMAMMATSTVADHRTKVKPKPHGSYMVSPLLWAMLTGDPATRKSVPIREIEAIVRRLDQRDWTRRKFNVDTLVLGGMTQKDAEAAVPPARRRVVNDVTTEALCEVLAGQDCGAGLFRDELSGWIGAMDKYGGGGKGSAQDRSVFIKAHDGGPYRQDRAKGAARIVGNLSCSISGAVQPRRLAEMGRLDSDGLLQRFIPVMMAPAKPDDDNVRVVSSPFEQLIETIDRLPVETYGLSPGAAQVRRVFADKMTVAARIREPSESFGSFLGKQERTLNAVALILHLMDIAMGNWAADIPESTMDRALLVMEGFVLKHAYIFYASINKGWAEDQQALAAAFIRLAKGGKVKITKRDVDRTCQAARGMDMRTFQSAVLVFQANGWIVPEIEDHTNRAWFLNAEVAQKFSAEYVEYTHMCENVIAEITKKAEKGPL
jgi:hypothetical protein